LPPLELEELLETTKIHSVAGKFGVKKALVVRLPFRSPHHSISDVAFSIVVAIIFLAKKLIHQPHQPYLWISYIH